jgi:hypothetical protein
VPVISVRAAAVARHAMRKRDMFDPLSAVAARGRATPPAGLKPMSPLDSSVGDLNVCKKHQFSLRMMP